MRGIVRSAVIVASVKARAPTSERPLITPEQNRPIPQNSTHKPVK